MANNDLLPSVLAHQRALAANYSDSELKMSFSLEAALAVLRRRKIAVILSTIAVLCLAVAAALVLTPKYVSTATLEINREAADRVGLEELSGSPSSAYEAMEFNVTMDTHARALGNDTLALQVIEQLHLAQRPEFAWTPSRFDAADVKVEAAEPLGRARHKRDSLLKAFHHRLKVKSVTGTRLIQVSFKDADPQLAALIANTVANDYLEMYFRMRFKATAQVSDWLSRQLDQLKGQVTQADRKVVEYQRQVGILGTDESANVVMSKLDDLNRKLTEAEDNRITRQAIYELVKSGNPQLVSGLAGSTGAGLTGQNPWDTLQHLKEAEADLNVEYAEAAKKFGPAYPKIIEMKNQLNTLRASIEEESRNIAKRAENDYLAAQQAENMLKASFEEQKAEATKLNDKSIQFSILKHEADASRELYDSLELKLKSAGVLSGLRSTNILVLDPARPAADPVRPPSLIVGFGLLAGLLAGIALAFTREAMDTTIRNPYQASAISALPQLGLIPDVKTIPLTKAARRAIARSSRPLAVAASGSLGTEAYRQLRTAVYVSANEMPRVVLITSPLMDDGKTTTAVNLAIVLAQQGAKVLLVDADLRRPSIQRKLGIESGIDLGRLLSEGGGSLPQAAVSYPHQSGLSVLTARRMVPYAGELLGSSRMVELLTSGQKEFDFVVLDSSPVLSVTDAVVLSPMVDSVVLVARAEVTPREALVRARDLLVRANANIAGVLVNAVNLKSADYRHYYGERYVSRSLRRYHDNEVLS